MCKKGFQKKEKQVWGTKVGLLYSASLEGAPKTDLAQWTETHQGHWHFGEVDKKKKTFTHLVKNTLTRQIMPAVLDEECRNPETGGPPREKKYFLSSNILKL